MRRKTAFHPIAHLPSFWQIFFLLHVVTNFLLSVDLVPGLGRGSEHFFLPTPLLFPRVSFSVLSSLEQGLLLCKVSRTLMLLDIRIIFRSSLWSSLMIFFCSWVLKFFYSSIHLKTGR